MGYVGVFLRIEFCIVVGAFAYGGTEDSTVHIGTFWSLIGGCCSTTIGGLVRVNWICFCVVQRLMESVDTRFFFGVRSHSFFVLLDVLSNGIFAIVHDSFSAPC